jgi:hypothetical protein
VHRRPTTSLLLGNTTTNNGGGKSSIPKEWRVGSDGQCIGWARARSHGGCGDRDRGHGRVTRGHCKAP